MNPTRTSPSINEAVAYAQPRYTRWTEEQFIYEFLRCIDNGSMLFSVDDLTGKLNGVVTAKIDDEIQSCHITCIVADSLRVVYLMLTRFMEKWPGYILSGDRHDKHYIYDLNKLKEKLYGRTLSST